MSARLAELTREFQDAADALSSMRARNEGTPAAAAAALVKWQEAAHLAASIHTEAAEIASGISTNIAAGCSARLADLLNQVDAMSAEAATP